MPLNRQEKRWHRLGLPLNRRTLSQWVITTSERFLAPLFDMLHDKLLSETVLHADETPVQALASEKVIITVGSRALYRNLSVRLYYIIMMNRGQNQLLKIFCLDSKATFIVMAIALIQT